MSRLHLNTNIIGLFVLKSSSQRFLRPLASLSQAKKVTRPYWSAELLFQMLLLVIALVTFSFLEAILNTSVPTQLPAMAGAEITPSPLQGLPNSQRSDFQGVYVKCTVPRGEKIAERSERQYTIASLLSIIPHPEHFFPLHNFLSG